MKQFRYLFIFLFLFCPFITGCLTDDDDKLAREPYHKYFEIINNTDETIKVEYVNDVEEAIWEWDEDEYEYKSLEIPPHENDFVTILVTDYNEHDILTFTMGSHTTDLIGYWRESEIIEVTFNDESQEMEFGFIWP